LLAGGCITRLEEHETHVGEVARDWVVPVPANVAALGPPVSLEYPDASLWIWPDLDNAFARLTSIDEVCVSGPVLQPPLFTLSAGEVTANETRTDGRQLAVVPTGGLAEAGTGYIYYDHVLWGPGLFDAEVLGTGLCVLPPGASSCERVEVNGSTLLWTPVERVLDRGGFVIDDPDVGRRAIIAGCRKVASFEHPCTLTGVPVDALRDPTSYRVFDVFEGWVERLVDASVLTDSVGAFTLSHFDGAFLAIQLDIFDHRVYVQWSPNALADYGDKIATFGAVPPAGPFLTGGREHAALRTRPRSMVVTYVTDGTDAPGLHLVDFHFYGEGELR
jgi:hypothetical protein